MFQKSTSTLTNVLCLWLRFCIFPQLYFSFFSTFVFFLLIILITILIFAHLLHILVKSSVLMSYQKLFLPAEIQYNVFTKNRIQTLVANFETLSLRRYVVTNTSCKTISIFINSLLIVFASLLVKQRRSTQRDLHTYFFNGKQALPSLTVS